MQRHLSTGSHLLAALMQADRRNAVAAERGVPDPLQDVLALLAAGGQDAAERAESRPG